MVVQESPGGEEEHEEESPSHRHGLPVGHLLAAPQHSQLGGGSGPPSQDLEVVPPPLQACDCLSRYYYFSFFCFHLLAMCSTICNMLVYGWLNENIASQSHIFRDIRCSVLPCQITLDKLKYIVIH